MSEPRPILIIEDVEADFALLAQQLRRHGLNVRCVRVASRTGLHQALGAGDWHAVLAHHGIPGIDCHAYLADIRARAPEVPVIVISGHVGEEEMADLFALGAVDLVLTDRLARLGPAVERSLQLGSERRRRHAAEQALRDHQERLRLALVAAEMNAFEYDPATDQVRRTGGLSDILGLPEIGTGADFLAMVHPADVDDMVRVLQGLTPDAPSYRCEYRVRAPDGSYHWIADTGAARFDDEGRINRIVGIRQDISLRKEVEDTLRQATTVFASTQEGVAITDPDGNILRANPAFTTITEYEEAEYLGRNIRLLASGRQDRAFFQSMWAALRSVGYWQGEIWNRRKSGEIYPEWLTISTVRDDLGRATGYVGVFTDISRIRHAATHLEHLAHHDALTDLPNRVLLRSRLGHSLDRARRSGSGCAVIFLDLDHFKPVNDRLGHLAGDELLRQVATRIRSRLREPDTLARWGGDEFVAVIEDIGDGAARLAGELIDLLQPPFVLAGGALASIGASAGVSLFPRDGDGPEPLLRHADEALYQAKNAGRNCWRIYGEAPGSRGGPPRDAEG